MRVTVRSIGPLRQVLGGAELELAVPEGSTMSGLLARLAEEKGPEMARYVVKAMEPSAYAPLRVVVNGRDILPPQYQEAALTEGDDILLFTPIAGG